MVYVWSTIFSKSNTDNVPNKTVCTFFQIAMFDNLIGNEIYLMYCQLPPNKIFTFDFNKILQTTLLSFGEVQN